MSIQDDISKAIKANLPAEVGAALQERLVQADAFAKEIDLLNRLLKNTEARLAETKASLDEHVRKLSQHADLDKREAAISDRERIAEILELRCSLEAEKRVSKAFETGMAGLVRNVEWRNSVFSKVPVPVEATPPMGYSHSGSPAHVQVTDATRTENISAG